MNESDIEFVDTAKYLGVMISTQMCDADLRRQIRKFYANSNVLIRNFSQCSFDVKRVLFASYCTHLYCSQLWFNTTKSAFIISLR